LDGRNGGKGVIDRGRRLGTTEIERQTEGTLGLTAEEQGRAIESAERSIIRLGV
jgi:hypothetical protein